MNSKGLFNPITGEYAAHWEFHCDKEECTDSHYSSDGAIYASPAINHRMHGIKAIHIAILYLFHVLRDFETGGIFIYIVDPDGVFMPRLGE